VCYFTINLAIAVFAYKYIALYIKIAGYKKIIAGIKYEFIGIIIVG